MKRKIAAALEAWKNSKDRKPLIINGARQVGKTYILERYGRENFDNVVFLNMEIEGVLRNFLDAELEPRKIIQFIEARKGQRIMPGKTLIFFDEIQACERALTALKYFLRTDARLSRCGSRIVAWSGGKSRKILVSCGES
jgi:predicted AAA+ superfamily ATPase